MISFGFTNPPAFFFNRREFQRQIWGLACLMRVCVCVCVYVCMFAYMCVCVHICMYIMYVCMYVRYCFLLLCVTQLEDKTFSHSRSFETDLVILPGLNLLVHNLKFISMPSNILYPVYTLFSRRLLPLLSHTFIFQKHTFPEFGILS